MIKKYGTSVSPWSTPATMSKYSVSLTGGHSPVNELDFSSAIRLKVNFDFLTCVYCEWVDV